MGWIGRRALSDELETRTNENSDFVRGVEDGALFRKKENAERKRKLESICE